MNHYPYFPDPFTFGGSGGIPIVERGYPTVLRIPSMTTRSGHGYQQVSEEATMEKEKTVQELMQMLVEDRRRREDELAAERIRREEIAAERAKQDEERSARERRMQARMDEFAAERAQREDEVAAERARREEEIAAEPEGGAQDPREGGAGADGRDAVADGEIDEGSCRLEIYPRD